MILKNIDMESIGTVAGLLYTDYKSSICIVTVLQNPTNGQLISVLVDDGEDIQEYNYNKGRTGISYGTDQLQWGLFA